MNFLNLKKYLDCENDELFQMNTLFRGISSKKDIEKDTIIMKIPFEKLIQISSIPYYSFFKNKLNHENSILALFLSFEYICKNQSKYLSILKAMPKFKDLENFPFFLSHHEFSLLNQSHMKMQMKNYIENHIHDYNQLKRNREYIGQFVNINIYPSFYLFLYYRLLVTSRVFGYEKEFKHESALVPYADLLNHSIQPNTTWYFDDALNSFVVKSTKFIKKNEEIYDSYGNKPNDTLYLYYGFTIKNNPNLSLIHNEYNQIKDIKMIFKRLLKNVKETKNYNVKNIIIEEISNLLENYPFLKQSIEYLKYV